MRRQTADPVKARTRQMYSTLKRRAGKEAVMSLEEFRAHYDRQMSARPLCPYCNAKLTCATVSLDHIRPVFRNGDHSANNLLFVCSGCNKAKGQMTAAEYVGLLNMLDVLGRTYLNPKLREWVVTALRVAQSFRQGANRRAKR